MSLNVRWSETALLLSNEEFNNRAESVAFYMMFCGVQEITSENVGEFALRWNLWDVTVNGKSYATNAERVEILTPFIGTTANVTAKTFHAFLTGDIKRIARERF